MDMRRYVCRVKTGKYPLKSALADMKIITSNRDRKRMLSTIIEYRTKLKIASFSSCLEEFTEEVLESLALEIKKSGKEEQHSDTFFALNVVTELNKCGYIEQVLFNILKPYCDEERTRDLMKLLSSKESTIRENEALSVRDPLAAWLRKFGSHVETEVKAVITKRSADVVDYTAGVIYECKLSINSVREAEDAIYQASGYRGVIEGANQFSIALATKSKLPKDVMSYLKNMKIRTIVIDDLNV